MMVKSSRSWFIFAGIFALSACTSITTRVAVTTHTDGTRLDAGYAIVQVPIRNIDKEYQEIERLVNARLIDLGLFYQSSKPRYLLSIASDSRPDSVDVCDEAQVERCRTANGRSPFSWFAGSFRHSLTLEFFDANSGQQIYKVTASRRDNMADSGPSDSYLVQSALAQLPFAHTGMYRVKVHTTGTRGGPKILSIESDR